MNSMKKMRDFAPQLAKLKKKYKGNNLKFAKAQSDFYKTNGIKPGAGCLPYLLQIIILIAFFNVFTKTLSAGGDITSNFNELLYAPLKFIEGTSINTKFLYLDVSSPDIFNIAGLPFPIPGPILVLSSFFQLLSAKIMIPYSKQEEKIAKKTKDQTDDIQVAMQKSMTYTFPLITLFIGVRFPSGLAIYWLMFSLFQVYQQYKSQGWGGLTPWIRKVGLLKSETR
jgi:YidC/Oxa1 family membrane protein insertase